MNKYDLIFYVQAKNCNPNGDPDMGNAPRIDAETNCGIMTAASIKRKIRDYIQLGFNNIEGMDIIMKNATNLNRSIAECAIEANDGEIKNSKGKTVNPKVKDTTEIACKKYWDVRTFGGVLTTGLNGGQITGPVQFNMPISIDPVITEDISITRMCYAKGAYTTLEEYDKDDINLNESEKRTMGRHQYLPYGLYEVHAHISPSLAEKTGFTEKDFNYLLEAICNMYENGNSNSKTGMSVVGPIIIFKHIGTNSKKTNPEQYEREIKLGCAQAHKLFKLINVHKKENVEFPRDYTDYNATVNLTEIPNGIQIGFKYNPFEEIIWNKPLNNDWLIEK